MNKKILVTGASSGIGKQIALSCSRMGAQLVIMGRSSERLDETFEALDGQGHERVILDLKDIPAVTEAISKIQSFDGVVNSIGFSKLMPIRMMNYETLNELMATNFMATANLTHELLFKNKINQCGSIVFMSSISARAGVKGIGGYSAAKAATNSYMRTLAQECCKKMIRVNCLAPASVDTPIWGNADARPVLDRISSQYPLGIGQPEDVANAAIYLLSEASRWVTGTELAMEGGLVHHV